jgi:hypothetical protein
LREDGDVWDLSQAPGIADDHLAGLGRRWDHVRAVGRLADELVAAGLTGPTVAAAAWLHDLGYAPSLRATGLHAVDGAAHLETIGVPDAVVGLVAWHTGAAFEAEERGLTSALDRFPKPDPDELATLTLLDLVVGPDGRFTTPCERLSEILQRYEETSAVHRAVSSSRTELLAAAERARTLLALPDEWPVGSVEGVL